MQGAQPPKRVMGMAKVANLRYFTYLQPSQYIFSNVTQERGWESHSSEN